MFEILHNTKVGMFFFKLHLWQTNQKQDLYAEKWLPSRKRLGTCRQEASEHILGGTAGWEIGISGKHLPVKCTY